MNPTLGFEDALAIRPAEAPKKVAVVGGGPAGLKAADTAALRGHEVTLFEKRALGGYLHEASYPEFKADIRDALKIPGHAGEQARRKVVEKEAALEDLKGFDAVIVAAGTTPAGLRVPGADRPEVSIAVDALRPDGIRPTGEIVVIGGGLIGVETAIQFSRTDGKPCDHHRNAAPDHERLQRLRPHRLYRLDQGKEHQGLHLRTRDGDHGGRRGVRSRRTAAEPCPRTMCSWPPA